MQAIDAKVSKLAEADKILQGFEKVRYVALLLVLS